VVSGDEKVMQKMKNSGEFELIDKLKKRFKSDKSVICSIGDDAAAIEYNSKKYLLFASDMLVEDVHFKVAGQKNIFEKIGHKALACNISDIAGMGGVPKYAVISLGLPPRLAYRRGIEISSGVRKLAKKFSVNIVGGDICASEKIVINVSVIGFVEKKNLILRSGAGAGDIIFVTGPLGGSAAVRHLAFTPRLKEAQYLVKKYKINSMIDISYGLVGDLRQIMKASGKGALLFEEFIPISREAKGIEAAFYEGEDFELLFTADAKTAGRILENKKIKAYAIGKILKNKKIFDLVDSNGRKRKIKPGGYRHF